MNPKRSNNGSHLEPWPTLGTEVVGDFKIFTLQAMRKRSPRTGLESTYYALDTVDWVNTVAVTPDNQLVMVEQYRHATNTIELELPGGMMNPAERDPIIAACRELREETGYEGQNARIIGTCFANPAILTNKAHTILVENCLPKYQLEWDSGEDINIRLIPISELDNLVTSGQIRHSIMIAALHYFSLATHNTNSG